MTHKVVQFSQNKGGYYVNPHGNLQMCGARARGWLDVGDQFEMHLSTNKPSHDEYYVLKPSDNKGCWVFANGEDEGSSPWLNEIDEWLIRQFGKKPSNRVYAWAMG